MINAGYYNNCKNLSGLTQSRFISYPQRNPIQVMWLSWATILQAQRHRCFHLAAAQSGICDFQGHQRTAGEDKEFMRKVSKDEV